MASKPLFRVGIFRFSITHFKVLTSSSTEKFNPTFTISLFFLKIMPKKARNSRMMLLF